MKVIHVDKKCLSGQKVDGDGDGGFRDVTCILGCRLLKVLGLLAAMSGWTILLYTIAG